jgi:glycosyltransferase involved in cell wall biosynthesis
MDVSILICTRDRAESLRQTLAAMESHDFPASCELVVVDNASTDHTLDIVRSTRIAGVPVRYVREERRGLSNARNAAVAAARGEVLLFTDDDVRPVPGWAAAMCAPIAAGRAEVVAGGVTIAPYLLRPWMTPFHHSVLASTERLQSEAEMREVVGANMAFARRVLGSVPGFDPELGAGALGFAEESLFARQLIRAGFRIAPAFGASVEHHFDARRLAYPSWIRAMRNLGRSWAYLDYHWEHKRLRSPLLSAAKRPLRLRYWRVKRRLEWPYAEGAPEWESRVEMDIHYLRQYLRERRRPPRYEKRPLSLGEL